MLLVWFVRFQQKRGVEAKMPLDLFALKVYQHPTFSSHCRAGYRRRQVDITGAPR